MEAGIQICWECTLPKKASGFEFPNTLECTLPNCATSVGEASLGDNLVNFTVCWISGHPGRAKISTSSQIGSQKHIGLQKT